LLATFTYLQTRGITRYNDVQGREEFKVEYGHVFESWYVTLLFAFSLTLLSVAKVIQQRTVGYLLKEATEQSGKKTQFNLTKPSGFFTYHHL
jgi:hypothetical protein